MPLRVHGVPGCADWPASPNRRSELGDRTPNDATERRRRVRHHERRTALRHSVVVVGKRVERAHRVLALERNTGGGAIPTRRLRYPDFPNPSRTCARRSSGTGPIERWAKATGRLPGQRFKS